MIGWKIKGSGQTVPLEMLIVTQREWIKKWVKLSKGCGCECECGFGMLNSEKKMRCILRGGSWSWLEIVGDKSSGRKFLLLKDGNPIPGWSR